MKKIKTNVAIIVAIIILIAVVIGIAINQSPNKNLNNTQAAKSTVDASSDIGG